MNEKRLTPNELADLLDFDAKTLNWKAFADAATMLRQQQIEIERLGSELNRIVELYTDKAIENEALKKEAALQRLSDFTQEVEAKYSDAWWKEVDEFNKQLKAQEK